ncbi:hypothetical protein [Hymenobacter lucidus]|uniref:DUF2135 domain-containing protein n=1 Tax=Hymenobacter lucidus TaxID=2880930 RepID=A0ABS8AKQ9_9BACT|nr:hypothetical protein [Hymenobacter lucidus]MCB2406724.1 hypothetical protein [Hymenobacter lucidus]
MPDQNRYEQLRVPQSFTITSLVFRSPEYYDNWLSSGGDSPDKTQLSFHCSACTNPAVKITVSDGHYLDGNTGPVLDKAAAAYGGIEGVNEIKGYHFSGMYAYYLRCNQCQTTHLVVVSYTEHQPSRDVFKLSTIFTIEVN